MEKQKILVVDDEEDLQELLRYNLEKEGYIVTCVGSGEESIAAAKKQLPNLILLDLMLPGMDGFEVCRILKNDVNTSSIPIVMLTAKGEDSDIIAGLELGADDYITKPFSPKVLIVRLKMILQRGRRNHLSTQPQINRRQLAIDPTRHCVLVKGKNVDLTATEFAILHFIASRPGWVFTRSQLIDAIRGKNCAVTDRSIDVQIVGLRKKLGVAGKDVETVHGVGYRFKE